MQLEPEILELLRCPLTGTRLIPTRPELIDSLNIRIRNGDVTNRSGEAVTEPIEAAYQDESGTWLAVVRGGIITLVAERLISVPKAD